jgi:hypothetical protein
VSINFYGKKADGEPIMLRDHPAAINMSSGNGRAFLEFLGVDPGVEPAGEITMVEARRAVIYGRATYERRAPLYVREWSDTKRPGRPRIIEGGLPKEYFSLRLDHFERLLNVLTEMGATSIYWA